MGPEDAGGAHLQRQLAWVDDSASGRTRQWQLLDLHRQSANSARLTVHEVSTSSCGPCGICCLAKRRRPFLLWVSHWQRCNPALC